jgi:hypothetical protein
MTSLPDKRDRFADTSVGYPGAEASITRTAFVCVDKTRIEGTDPGGVDLIEKSVWVWHQGCSE